MVSGLIKFAIVSAVLPNHELMFWFDLFYIPPVKEKFYFKQAYDHKSKHVGMALRL
jgi:hypothetical protein